MLPYFRRLSQNCLKNESSNEEHNGNQLGIRKDRARDEVRWFESTCIDKFWQVLSTVDESKRKQNRLDESWQVLTSYHESWRELTWLSESKSELTKVDKCWREITKVDESRRELARVSEWSRDQVDEKCRGLAITDESWRWFAGLFDDWRTLTLTSQSIIPIHLLHGLERWPMNRIWTC